MHPLHHHRWRAREADTLRGRAEDGQDACQRVEVRKAAEHGAYNVRTFGSVARGEAEAASDVDFLVEMVPGRCLLDLGGLLMDLQNLLGWPVDVVTERELRKRIRDQVLKEAVAL